MMMELMQKVMPFMPFVNLAMTLLTLLLAAMCYYQIRQTRKLARQNLTATLRYRAELKAANERWRNYMQARQ